MTEGNINELVAEFAKAAHRAMTSTKDGSWFTMRPGTLDVARSYAELKRMGTPGREAMLSLLHDGDASVRLMAAVFSLSYDESRSQAALRLLRDGNVLESLVAASWLDRWEKTRWENDPWDLATAGILQGGEPKDREIGAPLPLLLDRVHEQLFRNVRISEIASREHLDERVSAVNAVCPFTVGVNAESIEWVPDHEPPTRDEMLSWLWLIRPELGESIAASTANPLLKQVIGDYSRAFTRT